MLKRTNGYAFHNLGNAFLEANRLDEAEQAYIHALSLIPGNPQMLDSIGLCMTRQGRLLEGVNRFLQANEQNPALPNLHINPDIEIVGVQTSRFPSMKQALAGEPIHCGRLSIAEGIAVKTPGKKTLPIIRQRVSDILLVDESEIESAVRILLDMEKTVVEGAGAAGLAALIKHQKRFSGRKVGLVLSGGNIDPLVLASIIKRGLVHSGRMIRLHVEVRDVPGALAEVSRCIGEAGANIVEVHHQRSFTSLPLQSAEVEFILITRGSEHVGQILSALSAGGFKTRLMGVSKQPETVDISVS